MTKKLSRADDSHFNIINKNDLTRVRSAPIFFTKTYKFNFYMNFMNDNFNSSMLFCENKEELCIQNIDFEFNNIIGRDNEKHIDMLQTSVITYLNNILHYLLLCSNSANSFDQDGLNQYCNYKFSLSNIHSQ